MTTTQPSLADVMTQAHAALMKDLQKLRQASRAPSAAHWQSLRDRLLAVQRDITEHFRFEEQNGYMMEVLKRKPILEREVAKLRDDHRALADGLAALIAETRSASSPDASWAGKVEAWIDEVRQHEKHENDLIQEAFNLDVAAED